MSCGDEAEGWLLVIETGSGNRMVRDSDLTYLYIGMRLAARRFHVAGATLMIYIYTPFYNFLTVEPLDC